MIFVLLVESLAYFWVFILFSYSVIVKATQVV